MKKRFTATVALITLLSSSTAPTLTQAAEQLKVSQPNTTSDSSQDTDQETVATASVDTTTERRQNTDTTKKVSSQTKESTTQTTTTEAKDSLSSERTAAIKEIQKLSALNNRASYIEQINNAKTKSEIDTVVTKAQENNLNKVIADKKNKIHNLKNLTNKESYISKIKAAKSIDAVNSIYGDAVNENRKGESRTGESQKGGFQKGPEKTPTPPQSSKPGSSSLKTDPLKTKRTEAIQEIQNLPSLNNKASYIAQINNAKTKSDINTVVTKAQGKSNLNTAITDKINKIHNLKNLTNKESYINKIRAAKSIDEVNSIYRDAVRKNKENTVSQSNKDGDAGKGTTKTAVAKPKQKYKNSASSYKATQRQAMAAAAIAKLDDELQIGADENPVKITPNMTGKEFIEAIADYATEVADKNDLYASVMIAQACLESGFGTSGLASSPYYNLFGIKGAYKGKSVHMQTLEDGSNGMYSINAGFRDYPSPKESLEDYADLLSTNFYKGAHKSKTSTYRDATRFLTGRYATDRNYARKLNGIIEAYDLTQYDEGNGKLKRIKKITNVYYKVKPGDTIKSIAKAHHNSVKELKEWNKKTLKDVNLIYPGQKIIADQKVTYKYIKVKDSDDKQAAKNGKFNLPLKKGSYTVTSPFGGRKAPNAAAGNYHEGIDLAVPMNSNVYAARDGVVFATGYDGSAGNYIFLYHGNGLFSNYFHLTSAKVKVGDHVNAGDLIAKSGSTGNSTGPHLHFGISHRLWGDYENPEDYLNFR